MMMAAHTMPPTPPAAPRRPASTTKPMNTGMSRMTADRSTREGV